MIKAWGIFFTGRASGEELTERACQRRVQCLEVLVVMVWTKRLERKLGNYLRFLFLDRSAGSCIFNVSSTPDMRFPVSSALSHLKSSAATQAKR